MMKFISRFDKAKVNVWTYTG